MAETTRIFASMAFQYSALALDSNQLRVLKPVSNANKRILKFEILEVPRAKAPLLLYTAVSYTWGDGEQSEIIFVNGKTFHISVTLWSCLYYLCLHEKIAIWTHIWVDAICINQKNGTEKTAQVRCNAGRSTTYRRGLTCVGLVGEAGTWSQRLLVQVLHVTSMCRILY
jgi:hypothetical protein